MSSPAVFEPSPRQIPEIGLRNYVWRMNSAPLLELTSKLGFNTLASLG